MWMPLALQTIMLHGKDLSCYLHYSRDFKSLYPVWSSLKGYCVVLILNAKRIFAMHAHKHNRHTKILIFHFNNKWYGCFRFLRGLLGIPSVSLFGAQCPHHPQNVYANVSLPDKNSMCDIACYNRKNIFVLFNISIFTHSTHNFSPTFLCVGNWLQRLHRT